MFLIEHDGKALLARHGVAVPEGRLLDEGDAFSVPASWSRAAVKAQLAAGGRGKRGLVRVVDAADAAVAAAEISAALSASGARVLLRLEQAQALRAEWYMACRVDDISQAVEWTFSTAGGVEVEQQAGSLARVRISPLRNAYPQDFIAALRQAGVPLEPLAACARLAASLCRALVAEDADVIEINPLALLDNGRLMALDAKVSLDDSAAWRHPGRAATVSAELVHQGLSPLEAQALKRGFQFIDMPGDIAVLTSGAGQGMLLADMLQGRGWHPANFTDASGGGSSDTVRALVELVFERARRDDVRGILAFFITSATPIERVVHGLIDALRHCPAPKPMALGLSSSGAAVATMSLAQAHAAMAEAGMPCCGSADEALDQLDALLRC